MSKTIRCVTKSSKLPEIYITAFRNDKHRILNIFRDYQARLEKAVGGYQEAVTSVKNDSRHLLFDEMKEGYLEAQQVTGIYYLTFKLTDNC